MSVRWFDAPLPCPWCILVTPHQHSLRDDGTIGAIVLKTPAAGTADEGNQP